MSVALPETRTLTTKEQWWDFVKYEPPQRPQEPSPTELAAMSKTASAPYARARRRPRSRSSSPISGSAPRAPSTSSAPRSPTS